MEWTKFFDIVSIVCNWIYIIGSSLIVTYKVVTIKKMLSDFQKQSDCEIKLFGIGRYIIFALFLYMICLEGVFQYFHSQQFDVPILLSIFIILDIKSNIPLAIAFSNDSFFNQGKIYKTSDIISIEYDIITGLAKANIKLKNGNEIRVRTAKKLRRYLNENFEGVVVNPTFLKQ